MVESKKMRLLLVVLVAIVFAGCVEKDLAYYQTNIDDAQEKLSDCEASVKAAIMTGNESSLKEIIQDIECDYAKKAVRQYKNQVAEAKRALEQQQYKVDVETEINNIKSLSGSEYFKEYSDCGRGFGLKKTPRCSALNSAYKSRNAERQKDNKRKFEARYKKQINRLNKLPFSEFVKLSRQCAFNRSNKKAICKAFNELIDKRKIEEVKRLKTELPNGRISAFHTEKCTGNLNINRQYCRVVAQAKKEQVNDKVAYYVKHRDKMVQDYNDCYYRISKLRKSNKYRETSKAHHTFQCSTVSKAATKYKVYGFNRPIR